MVWSVPTDCRAVESPDPVNYRWVEGRLVDVQRTPDGFATEGEDAEG